MLGCCVLSLSRDSAEQVGSRRAPEKNKSDAQQGTVSSVLGGSFQVWCFSGDAF